MKIEKVVERILQGGELKPKKKYTYKEASKYIKSLKLPYISFWMVVDYLEDNNLIIHKE